MRTRTGSNMLRGLAVGAIALLGAGTAQAAVSINVGSASGKAGDTVEVSVTLTADGGEHAVGTQNDTTFDPASITVVAKANKKPDCAVNPDIDKTASSFAFRTATGTCDPTTTACSVVRAIVLSTDNVDDIPNGATLYTCKVKIGDSTPEGSYPLTASGAIASDPSGTRLSGVTANNGAINVTADTPTPTPTDTPPPPTDTPVPPTPTVTNTVPPTNTPVPSTPTNTRPPGGDDDDDGCQIVATQKSHSAWLLLLPAAALLWLRRRPR
ncbi:MAG: hypothetical protein HY699_13390 [Deltaproteobacteria bacterium]|nr:hypothetical protein [Deltaproteobacteria bacterium]